MLLRWTRAGGGLGALGLLAACAGGDIGEAPQATPAPPPTTQQLGTGGTVVALLLPLGAQGNAGIVALSMKNSAELAVAEAAVAEGAKVVIGPLFAHSVAAAAQVTRPLNIPVIAFSTDANVAGNGVFLLSFLPSGDVERIVRFEVSQNRRSFAALLPESAYGTVVEGALQQAVASAGGRVAVMERFGTDRAKMGEVARRVAPALAQADVLFIPDTPDQALQMVQMLAANGVDLKRLRLAGTGLWDDQRLYSDAMFDGAQFAAPDLSGWRTFSERYRARFGADPVRTATLSYDAVSLVTAMVRASGPDGVSIAALSSASGFSGVEGAFRFRADGTIERGLAVMEIKAGAVQVASPAPRSFAQL